MKPPLIIYHAGCMDGFTAAWAAWEWARRDADLVPAHYGDTPPDVTDRDVVIVDFAYPRAVLLEMHVKARSLLVLDHHRTAAEDLEGLSFATFDMERSGAGLAWDLLHTEPRPWLIDYVEDRDLWRFALPNSREVNASLRTLLFDLESWSLLSWRSSPEEHAPLGRAILADHENTIARHVERARSATIEMPSERWGFDALVVNATTLISEIGNVLARRAPCAAMWREHPDGGYLYSLRSAADNPAHVDVSMIARAFGGGGHRHAAGFRSDKLVHVRIARQP